MSAKAMIEESGVFSSWLTRVRKSVLAALSSSRRAFVSSAGSMTHFFRAHLTNTIVTASMMLKKAMVSTDFASASSL